LLSDPGLLQWLLSLRAKKTIFVAYLLYLVIEIKRNFISNPTNVDTNINLELLYAAKIFSLAIFALGFYGYVYRYRFPVSKHLYDFIFVLSGYLLAYYYFLATPFISSDNPNIYFLSLGIGFQIIAVTASFVYVYGKNGVCRS